MWWLTPVMLARGRLREQDCHKFKSRWATQWVLGQLEIQYETLFQNKETKFIKNPDQYIHAWICHIWHSGKKAGYELRDPPSSASQLLGLKGYATTTWLYIILNWKKSWLVVGTAGRTRIVNQILWVQLANFRQESRGLKGMFTDCEKLWKKWEHWVWEVKGILKGDQEEMFPRKATRWSHHFKPISNVF